MLLGGVLLAMLAILALSVAKGFASSPPDPGEPSGNGVQPRSFVGNKTCSDLGDGWRELKVDPPTDGTYSDGYLTVQVDFTGLFVDWTSNLGVDGVFVKGGPDGNLYSYDPESTGDTLLHSPINPENGTYYGISHVSFCYDFELAVSKTADTSLTRTYEWEIDKTADEEYDLFRGDSQDHEWTVSVEKTGSTDSDWAVAGTITIENPAPFAATIDSVSDEITGFGTVSVDCGVTFPYQLAGGGTLECDYETDLPNGTSRVNQATVTTSGDVGGGTATADVDFSSATVTPVNDEINVSDTNGQSWGPVSDDDSWSYDETFACDDDEGENDNTATIDETGQYATATATINCYEIVVTKTAVVETYSQEFDWEITKGPNGDYDMFVGDSQVHEYTIDIVRSETPAEERIGVTGTINVSNAGNPIPATINSVSDVITGTGLDDVDATVDCGTLPTTIAAGGSLLCTYEATVFSPLYDLNTATATLQNYSYDTDGVGTADGTTDFSGTADVVIDQTSAEVLPVTVVDDHGTPDDTTDDESFGPFTDSDSMSYSRTFVCDDDEGTLTNTASVLDGQGATIDSDDATVTVSCHEISVTKDADTSLTRTWTWDIDKSADQTELLLSEGQLFQVNYTVTTSATSQDSAWAVDGNIAVSNPAPIDATINGVADLVSPDVAAAVDCGVTFPYTLVAGGTLNCTYSADLADATSRTNTATATLQNYAYAFDGSATEDGTTDASGQAGVDFATATVQEIDECIDVSDTNVGVLGTVCAADAPATFNYSLWFGAHPEADVVLECGENRHDNVASFVTNDTGTTGDDTWTVLADVSCDNGCTLTPGYWKTHSSNGPAPYDDTWALLLDGEATMFYLANQTYYDVLWTAPQGNAYYILAHAYIAAQLNVLNGADPTSVQSAITAADGLFHTYSPAQVAALKGKSGNDLRAQFINLATTLDNYNNGLIGPGHCSE